MCKWRWVGVCVRIHAANGLLIKDFSGEARKSRKGNGVEGQVRWDGIEIDYQMKRENRGGMKRPTWRRGRGKRKVFVCLIVWEGIWREKRREEEGGKEIKKGTERKIIREERLVRISTPIKRNSKEMKQWFCQNDCSVSVTLSALSRNIQ